MAGREVVLSERLQSLAHMVSVGKRVVDVGCDHGFLSIYLVQHGISPGVLAMDVRKGPLSRAQEHIAAYEMEDYIETRLSDGLCEYKKGEAESLVCAGMGGKLMMKILTDSREKAIALEELILQPQSELPAFRRFLKAEGYLTLEENILCEEGKYYFLFKVRFAPGEVQAREGESPDKQERLYEKYGEGLLKSKHPVLKEYLVFMQHTTRQIRQQIVSSLQEDDVSRTKERLDAVEQELADLDVALGMYE